MRLLFFEDLRPAGWRKSKAQTNRDIKAGKFPRPVRVGRAPVWPDHEIRSLFEKLVAERDAQQEVDA